MSFEGKVWGVCLFVVGVDGDNDIFPLAIYICRKEDGANWEDFLKVIEPYLTMHP